MDEHGHEDDIQSELSLRPDTLNQYIGQHNIKSNLDIFIKAAKLREEPLIIVYFMVHLV